MKGKERRQKPLWKRVRKPIPPPEKIEPSKKKGYTRRDKSWKKETE